MHVGIYSTPVFTLSISPLFLFRAGWLILTVTAGFPLCRRAMRLGCSGLKEISSSGLGKRLVLPFSVEISDESSTDGYPLEPCSNTHTHASKCRQYYRQKHSGSFQYMLMQQLRVEGPAGPEVILWYGTCMETRYSLLVQNISVQ